MKADKLQPANEFLVHSIFYTIQGEGPFTGRPAIFIRLAGCNLQCPGCDTEYTPSKPPMMVSEVYAEMHQYLESDIKPIVVITGGEPFRQNLFLLVETLQTIGLTVQIETNGTLAPFEGMATKTKVVCSPKTGTVNPKLLPFISAYKYVARAEDLNPADGLPLSALGHTAFPRLARPHEEFNGATYLQPMDEYDTEKNLVNMRACVASCMDHGHSLQLQIHKIAEVE